MIKKIIENVLFSKNRVKTNANIFSEIYKKGLWRESIHGGGIIRERAVMTHMEFHMLNLSACF